MIDDDDGWPTQGLGLERLSHALRHDCRNGAAVGEARRERDLNAAHAPLQLLEVDPEGRPNRSLRADEEGNENELTLAKRKEGANEGAERPGGSVIEFGNRYSVAVFPRDGMDCHACTSRYGGSDRAQVAMSGRFERTVID